MKISNNINFFCFNLINLTNDNKFIKFISKNKKIIAITVGIFAVLALIFAFFYRNTKTTPQFPKKEASPPPKKIPSIEEMFNMQIKMNKHTQQIDKATEAIEKKHQDIMQKAKAIQV